MNQAASYISQSAGHSGTATWYQGLPAGQNQPQDLVGGTPVPEPATFAILGLGILAIRRKRK
jgi:hypothetical protein